MQARQRFPLQSLPACPDQAADPKGALFCGTREIADVEHRCPPAASCGAPCSLFSWATLSPAIRCSVHSGAVLFVVLPAGSGQPSVSWAGAQLCPGAIGNMLRASRAAPEQPCGDCTAYQGGLGYGLIRQPEGPQNIKNTETGESV
mmetsp:Transcript_9112/g.21834  ORF Transcript_9112/g.21834 Transcript_9112/m.21834 type:complete len:146 (-) Transcript_9112:124-561(-)